ncbi:MAG: acireductone synthase [Hormoscilla sp. SP5CHS1]|nr:acireductone synthase [Hormoscilla sp. SP5CHS1]
MTQPYADKAEAILLDIEGTTTPVDYVFGVLFPFARDRLESFLAENSQDEEVRTDLAMLRQEYETDISQGGDIPQWQGENPIAQRARCAFAAVPYIHHLIDLDRKSTGLKSLQGKIWHQGYLEGTLRSQMFADVKSAFDRWTEAGKQVFIFSSGSIQAQKILFRYSDAGDLSNFLRGYFDTTTGPKKETDTYHKIARAIWFPPGTILFISDVIAELKAAHAAGMQTLFSRRPGNHTSDSEGFRAIASFDQV